MTVKEKLAILEDVMELDEGTLSTEDILDNYDEWDSLAAISLIAIMDERFHKILTGQDVKTFKTVSDVLSIME